MSDRKGLMSLIARNMPNVPSVLADKVLASKWLAGHDRRVQSEALRNLATKYHGFGVSGAELTLKVQYKVAAAFMRAEADQLENADV